MSATPAQPQPADELTAQKPQPPILLQPHKGEKLLIIGYVCTRCQSVHPIRSAGRFKKIQPCTHCMELHIGIMSSCTTLLDPHCTGSSQHYVNVDGIPYNLSHVGHHCDRCGNPIVSEACGGNLNPITVASK